MKLLPEAYPEEHPQPYTDLLTYAQYLKDAHDWEVHGFLATGRLIRQIAERRYAWSVKAAKRDRPC